MKPRLQTSLCKWFERNARDLPWRRQPTAYRVWISEIMLQQTRVEAVREKYIAFMRRFPSLRKLAAADIEDVLQAWSGLGYYRRARQLHAAARLVVAQHGGRLPPDAALLRALPGIGRYTAGAILSIAHNQPQPIVDGNVERVFARWHRIDAPAVQAATRQRMWQLATDWVQEGAARQLSPSVLNQSLMELGAVICTPRSPACDRCPAARHCGAAIAGEQTAYPAPRPRKVKQRVRYLLLAVRDKAGRVLLTRREQHDRSSLLPPGMWELPHAPWVTRQPPIDNLRAAVGRFEMAGNPAQARHNIMEYDITLAVQPAVRAGKALAGRWFTPSQAASAAMASATRKALALVWGRDGFSKSRDAL